MSYSAAASAQAGPSCASDTSHACWRQVTYTNFKDFAVGNGIVCMVGGNVTPTGDALAHPNLYSQNQGNEDLVECHKPQGYSGVGGEPFYVGHNGVQGAQNRVPGGVYDDGQWGGTPTGVLTFWGSNRKAIAVLTQTSNLLVTYGDPSSFYTGYKTWSLDRENLNASTGARLCIKGIYSLGYSGGTDWQIRGIGCNNEYLVPATLNYKGWVVSAGTYKDGGGGWGEWFALKSNNRVQFHWLEEDDPWELPALPSGAGNPLYVGSEYVIASGGTNRVFRWWNSAWQVQNVTYPYTAADEMRQIDDGSSFRGNNGEFFVWQYNARVYLHVP